MRGFFYAQSVAVIGTSPSAGNLGRTVIENLDDFGFKGAAFPVGPKPGSIRGKEIVPSVHDLPDGVDLALLLVKATDIPDIARACGRKKIRRLIISTAGFSEYDQRRKSLETEILNICREFDLRFIGPNCMAVANMHNGLFLPFGTYNPVDWKNGPVSIVSQSGAMTVSFAIYLSDDKIGVNKIACVGNKLNVDEVDLLAYFIEDPSTEIIFLYLESFSRGREFFELCKNSKKPIIIHKSNISSLSDKIARSHTTSIAIDDTVVDAALEQAGVIRVSNMQEMLNCVKVLLLPPLKGRRIIAASGSGGRGVVIADECRKNGLALPPIPQSFLDWAKGKGRAKIIEMTNPLDLGDVWDLSARNDIVEKALTLRNFDGLFVSLGLWKTWETIMPMAETFSAISQLQEKADKPIFIRAEADSQRTMLEMQQKVDQPFFTTTSGTFKAINQVLKSRDNKQRIAAATLSEQSINNTQHIESILSEAEANGRSLLEADGYRVMDAVGIHTAAWFYVPRDQPERVHTMNLTFPVALKALGDRIAHKTDVNGVRLHIDNMKALANYLQEMRSADELCSAHGFLVQEMVPQGREMIVGAKRDPQFGPVLMVGFGGIFVELLADVRLALPLVGMEQAQAMVESLKGYPILNGARGDCPADVKAICRIITYLSDLVCRFPSIGEVDLNPVKVLDQGDGAIVVDCKIFLSGA